MSKRISHESDESNLSPRSQYSSVSLGI